MTYGFVVTFGLGCPPSFSAAGYGSRESAASIARDALGLTDNEVSQLLLCGYLYLRESPDSVQLTTNVVTLTESTEARCA